MQITLSEIEKNVKPIGGRLNYDQEFIYELLAAYGRSQGNITRLRNGQLNVADNKAEEVAQKGIVYLKYADVSDDDLYAVVDDLKSSPTVVRYSTRFVIATNYHKLLAVDIKTGEPLDINIQDIGKHFTYFLPWAGMEKAQYISENHADVKAAEKMAKLFDLLVAHNGYTSANDWHGLTTFFTRLLFCFFAEDTEIFKKNQFVNAVASYTQEDGSDLRDFLSVLFASLDDEDKQGYPEYLAAFPYVNGKLFTKFTDIPKFNKEARKMLIEASSKLDWSDINPDIFGSMFQAVVRPGTRTDLGQHYTSVPNIMKTIEPLFLNELKDEFDLAYNDSNKLGKLLGRIESIKIFDPACGSGNFLIIAYKELRKLEHAIYERQSELGSLNTQMLSRVHIDSFYGIEIDDFAHEIAILSLWLAKHQMNAEFALKFGAEIPLIPLKEAGNIKYGNAARMNWSEVCPNNDKDEIYIISNPPFGGARKQNKSQKEDMRRALDFIKGFGNLDYVSIWFYKATEYIGSNQNCKYAMVSTNSIAQGTQVELLWSHILNEHEISFAYQSFKWSNNAKNKAGVTCVIISVRLIQKGKKHLFVNNVWSEVHNINAYLAAADDIFIKARRKPISKLPILDYGSFALDDGNFTISEQEYSTIISENPEAKQFLKPFIGAYEFLRSIKRYAVWIDDSNYNDAIRIPVLREKVRRVEKWRSGSDRVNTKKLAAYPYKFAEIRYKEKNCIIMPIITSEKREYIPLGYLTGQTIISNQAFAIYDADPYIFGLLSSKLHMTWVKAIAGQLETRIRYSAAIVYNNFPVPALRENEIQSIQTKALEVLDVRENHAHLTLAKLYDPDKMPADLRKAHEELDEVVDRIYRKTMFNSDEERLACLFDLYEIMLKGEILV
ncbi:MAG TPA: DNA methyltransferase [Candidatus Saccharimonadales bacterium]|nr:DNA methyltransferase [Candidatus Saccharimonadales bacterium]